ncbi:MAG TPA: hypothetical protein VN107_11155 [Microbacterium sp.]|nr:hypothetical protein [Microbacterium sp.]
MNDDSISLANERFAPITSRIGYLNLTLHDANDLLLEWGRWLYKDARALELSGGLVENVNRLEPLTWGNTPRELLVQTRNPEWTAYFDCLHGGTDPVGPIAYLTKQAEVMGVWISARPMIPPEGGRPWGSRQFYVHGPGGTDARNTVRGIDLVQDGARWHFGLMGAPLPFEDLDAYTRRRVLERFTGSMLESYARAMGLDAFDLDFYSGPSMLVTSAAPIQPDDGISLADRRRELGYIDVA